MIKKSQAKVIAFFVASIVILSVAFLQHPSLKDVLFPSYHYQSSWQKLFVNLNSNNVVEAQVLWQFREFYSRGTISLAKFQNLSIPANISDVYQAPTSFIPYSLYVSDQIESIEGMVDTNVPIFFVNEELLDLGWIETFKSNNVQIIENKQTQMGLIIGLYDFQEASLANGYLYFDLRDENFQAENNNKKWLVVSIVNLF